MKVKLPAKEKFSSETERAPTFQHEVTPSLRGGDMEKKVRKQNKD